MPRYGTPDASLLQLTDPLHSLERLIAYPGAPLFLLT